jgi:hypothetical protein
MRCCPLLYVLIIPLLVAPFPPGVRLMCGQKAVKPRTVQDRMRVIAQYACANHPNLTVSVDKPTQAGGMPGHFDFMSASLSLMPLRRRLRTSSAQLKVWTLVKHVIQILPPRPKEKTWGTATYGGPHRSITTGL